MKSYLEDTKPKNKESTSLSNVIIFYMYLVHVIKSGLGFFRNLIAK